MQKRSVFFLALLFMGLCGITGHLRVLSAGGAAEAVERQSTVTVTVATARGTIYDRKMRPLVNDGEETRLCIAPLERTLAALSSLMPAESFADLSGRLRGGRPVVVRGEETLSAAPGVLRFRVPVRNGGRLYAPHLVGYLSGDGATGSVGIEAAYDEWLRACTGEVSVTYSVNAAGGLLGDGTPKIRNSLEESGAGVVLTVDRDIQQMAEEVAEKQLKKGAVVIQDAGTGEVLASVSVPAFQPDTVAQLLESADSPLLNRAFCNYNCGSVFKIVSAAAALEAGVLPAKTYTCEGSITVDGVTFHCHNRLGHGELDMTEAFACSCNCYFIQLMQEVGARPLYDMAVALGFDRAILLGDNCKTARAVIPSLGELTNSPAALANLSFGQGSLLATPMHIGALAQAVVNGGEWLRPSVVRGVSDKYGTLSEAAATPPQTAFSPATAAVLKEMMIAAVGEESTGAAACPLNGGAGGKSGTAETGWFADGREKVQNWFVGFYPAGTPRYVVTVLAEDFGATGASAPAVFHRLCDGLYTFLLGNGL